MTGTVNTSFLDLSGTYVHQLNQYENKQMLRSYARRSKDEETLEDFVEYYFKVIDALKDTPAWMKPKTNEMLNDLTAKLHATLTRARSGKTSASAHAKALLRKIDWCAWNYTGESTDWHHISLCHLITREEADRLLSAAVA